MVGHDQGAALRTVDQHRGVKFHVGCTPLPPTLFGRFSFWYSHIYTSFKLEVGCWRLEVEKTLNVGNFPYPHPISAYVIDFTLKDPLRRLNEGRTLHYHSHTGLHSGCARIWDTAPDIPPGIPLSWAAQG